LLLLDEGAPRQEIVTGEEKEAWVLWNELRLQLHGCRRVLPRQGTRQGSGRPSGGRPSSRPLAFDYAPAIGPEARRQDQNAACEGADDPMDRHHDEPALADLLSDPVTLAVMNADGVDPGDLTATLTGIAAKFIPSPGSVGQIDRSAGSVIAKPIPADRKLDVAIRDGMTTGWDRSVLRNHLRLVSGLVLLAFVLWRAR
jgi:hypothetical protein